MSDIVLQTPRPVRVPLRVAVLTTKTPHHLYFLRELRKRCSDIIDLSLVLVEEKPFPYRKLFFRHIRRHWFSPLQWVLLNPYLHIPYRSKEQQSHEMERFFPGGDYDYDEGVRAEPVWSVNNGRAFDLLKTADPDLAFVYGTGLVKPTVFQLPRIGTFNLHGGFLPDYRGLDTNIWAALRGEYDKMCVALHAMDQTFDTGAVHMMEQIQPEPDLSVATLRYYAALLATDMCVRFLKQIVNGPLEAAPQPPGQGNYYSYVPWLLKPLADRKLRGYVRGRRDSENE